MFHPLFLMAGGIGRLLGAFLVKNAAFLRQLMFEGDVFRW